MKVFISWSGEISGRIARTLRDWLPHVIQSIQPYVSSEDIEQGARWATEISQELENSAFGIICVTRDNIKSPWLNFEAGALSKSLKPDASSKVCPFIFGLTPTEIASGPLHQFQCATYDKESIKKLMLSLNNASGAHRIERERLAEAFDVWWPKLDEELRKLSELVNKKILWTLEDSETNPMKEMDAIREDGYGNQTTWFLDKQEAPSMNLCDLVIHEFRKSNQSRDKLNLVLGYLQSAGGHVPVIVYTYYASGDKRLNEEEVSLLEEYTGDYVLANMPSTLRNHLRNIVNTMLKP
jgi:hypothetical protein